MRQSKATLCLEYLVGLAVVVSHESELKLMFEDPVQLEPEKDRSSSVEGEKG
jgi:hypothetical protein